MLAILRIAAGVVGVAGCGSVDIMTTLDKLAAAVPLQTLSAEF
jgi:hypothetical protein